MLMVIVYRWMLLLVWMRFSLLAVKYKKSKVVGCAFYVKKRRKRKEKEKPGSNN